MEQSIFTNYKKPKKGITKSDLVAFYATEMYAAEDLLKLGYKASNGVSLENRIKYLQDKIAVLENK